VKALRYRQDVDYYVTSQLLQPLSGAPSRGYSVFVEHRVRQKKRFQVRKWNAQIGGDLNAVYDVWLHGVRYTAFFNGDAMGKSLQGAGGALVMGVVFKAVAGRYELSESFRYHCPEEWLQECYDELQRVFLAFDGFMLATAVFGLADPESGSIYYVNAGHPRPALLRNDRAEFTGSERGVSRLGQKPDRFCVESVQLRKDDQLLCASDGRDDVLIADEMNEDYDRFLRLAERSGGDLQSLEAMLFADAEQADDLAPGGCVDRRRRSGGRRYALRKAAGDYGRFEMLVDRLMEERPDETRLARLLDAARAG